MDFLSLKTTRVVGWVLWCDLFHLSYHISIIAFLNLFLIVVFILLNHVNRLQMQYVKQKRLWKARIERWQERRSGVCRELKSINLPFVTISSINSSKVGSAFIAWHWIARPISGNVMPCKRPFQDIFGSHEIAILNLVVNFVWLSIWHFSLGIYNH